MKRSFTDLSKGVFDLIVIGGGIIGTGIARDAALRGFKTLLVEKKDYACGTTSSSTRLIHGGLRYLRRLELNLVRQDLRERETLLHIAPHLVQRLAFLIPLFRDEPLFRYSLPFGLRLYDFLARKKSLPSWKRLDRRETVTLEPSLSELPGLLGACQYYDCQAENMERLCLENVIDASQNGGTMLNYAEMTGFLLNGNSIEGIQVRDNVTKEMYTVRGKITLNAGGPWADLVLNNVRFKRSYHLRKTKGIHLLTKKISHNALVLFTKRDRRLFFVIPWGNYSLIGTTDTDYSGDLDNVSAEQNDIDYLVSETRNYFHDFSHENVHSTMAGLRALVSKGTQAESNLSRAHTLIDHERKDGVHGLVSVFGGKITAYRAIAEQAVDLVGAKLRRQISCQTAYTPLPGALGVSGADIEVAAGQFGIPVDTVAHLAKLYGSRFHRVLDYVKRDVRLANPISATRPDILAQIHHAVNEEQAITVNDFIRRRSTLWVGFPGGTEIANTVAHEMGTLLNWNDQETIRQIERYRLATTPG